MIPGVPAHARAAYATLAAALEEAGQVPCQVTGGEEWYSSDPAEREFAITCCRRCPVRRECATYADAADERFGVWGGVWREARPKAGAA